MKQRIKTWWDNAPDAVRTVSVIAGIVMAMFVLAFLSYITQGWFIGFVFLAVVIAFVYRLIDMLVNDNRKQHRRHQEIQRLIQQRQRPMPPIPDSKQNGIKRGWRGRR